ncbi:MAG TPA: homoserine kinase [Terriglobia bacterium]|nr:homoserine kinase [Terriglobia bacterium]
MKNRSQFRVPASTANLGAGFDALSLALDRYLTITVEPSPALEIVPSGIESEKIPRDATNLIYRVAARVAEHRQRSLPPFRMSIHNEIPLARGMGSSASAIIAGIQCYELLLDDALDEVELFQRAFEFEPHPDNLAAALYGGLISAAVDARGRTLVARLKPAEGAQGIVVIPSFELSTEKARGVLPASYSRADAVFNLQRSAMTIAAMTTGKWELLREGMRDRIHQPYRAKLIPGLEEILDLDLPGLFGIALSGAGPTVFAMAAPARAEAVGHAIVAVFEKNGVSAASHPVRVDRTGLVALV